MRDNYAGVLGYIFLVLGLALGGMAIVGIASSNYRWGVISAVIAIICLAASGLILVGTVLLVILIGFLFYFAAFAVGIYWLVMTVIATIKSNEGIAYRYPMTLRLVS